MSISLPQVEFLSYDQLSIRSHEVGARFARYLRAPYLQEPVAQFFSRAAEVPNLDAAALAIQDSGTAGPNLGIYGIADLSPMALPKLKRQQLLTDFASLVSALDTAVFEGPRSIGTSFEYINRHNTGIDPIMQGLRDGTLRSLCGIDLPPASHLAILSHASDHA